MKYFLLLAIACMFSVLGVAQTATDTTYVEILYFHGRQRCVTCKAIEEHTKEVVNTDLAEWVKMVNFVSKKLTFQLLKEKNWQKNIV